MRIVSIGPYVPHAAITHAGGAFLHHYLAGLAARGDEVELVAPDTPANRAACDASTPAGIAVRLVHRPITASKRWARVPVYPYEVLTAPTPGVGVARSFSRDQRVLDLINAADVVELQWSQYLPLVDVVRARRSEVVVSAVFHDLYGESLARLSTGSDSLRMRTVARLTAAHVRRRELAHVARCNIAFSFNERERAVVEASTGTPTGLLDPWIEWPASAHEPASAPTVLFTGDMSRPENHEAAVWLARDVWPMVRRRAPEAQLVLAGSSPPAAVTRLAGDSVQVTGTVPSLAPYYEAARVFAAPMRTGAGLKFKVAQALASGLPVVATSVAADGFAERGSGIRFGAVTDNSDDFAAALARYLEDRSLALRTGRDAASWARETFSFDQTVDRVRDAYEQALR
jgi:glycosyltransferase involved in cell wall biosynthesis